MSGDWQCCISRPFDKGWGKEKCSMGENKEKRSRLEKAALVLTVIRCVASLLKMLYEVVWE